MIKRRKKSLRISKRIFLFSLALLTACTHASTSTHPSQALPPSFAAYQNLPKLAVLPIMPYKRDPETGKTSCLLCNQSLSSGAIRNQDLSEFYHLVYFQLEKTYRFQILPERRAQSLFPDEKSYPETPEAWKQIYMHASTQGIPYLLAATLFRYDERQGDTYGVTKPASVAFDLHLIDAQNGMLIWSDHYFETQSALSENVLEIGRVFERKARWLTASELAREHLKKMFLQLPPLQEKIL